MANQIGDPILEGVPTSNEIICNSKVKLTPEGGLAVRLTNKTGGASIKGTILGIAAGTDNAFDLLPDDEPDVIGVVYEAGIADGQECWVVTNGICDIYFEAAVTRGEFARSQIDADGGTVGYAVAEAVPTSPFATDKHFQEVGHIIESTGGAGLAKCIIHFN